MTTEPVVAPLTVEEWHALIDAGLLEGQRVQLIDGRKFRMTPESARHSAMIGEVARQLDAELRARRLDAEAHVRQQHPLTLSVRDEPEPDLAVVRGRVDDYRDRHPGPGDVLLVVEVSLATRRMDLVRKARVYARGRVPEYWVVDLARDEVVRHRNPTRTGYGEVEQVPFGEPVEAASGPVVTIPRW